MKLFTQYVRCSLLTLYFSFSFYYTVRSQATPFNVTVEPPNVSTTQAPSTTIQVSTEAIIKKIDGHFSENAPIPPQKPPPALGLACNDTAQCKAEFSSCVNSTCSCQTGYISSKENLRCLKVVMKLGEGCSEDEQCSQGLNKAIGPTTCLNFICSCAIGMSLIDGKCQGPKVLTSKCTLDDECTIKKSHCRDGLCTCYDGFIPNSENNLCLPLNIQLQKMAGSPSSSCEEDVQCQETMGEYAICEVGTSGGTCQCKPGTHLVMNLCKPYKDLGDSCSHDIDCVTKDINTESTDSRICNNDVCKCNKGWVKEGSICKSDATQNTVAGVLLLLIAFWLMQMQ